MTTAVDKWPASARLVTVGTADHLPTALVHHSVGHNPKHQRVAEATVITPTPPDHDDICLAECAIAH